MAVLCLGATAAVSLAGCSSTQRVTDGQNTVSAGDGKATLTVDGKDQSISGRTGCVTTGNRVIISVGDQSRGVVGATISGDEIETLGIFFDGQSLGYTKGLPGSTATVKKDGNKYLFSGNLTGGPTPNDPTAGLSQHAFTMDVTCPG